MEATKNIKVSVEAFTKWWNQRNMSQFVITGVAVTLSKAILYPIQYWKQIEQNLPWITPEGESVPQSLAVIKNRIELRSLSSLWSGYRYDVAAWVASRIAATIASRVLSVPALEQWLQAPGLSNNEWILRTLASTAISKLIDLPFTLPFTNLSNFVAVENPSVVRSAPIFKDMCQMPWKVGFGKWMSAFCKLYVGFEAEFMRLMLNHAAFYVYRLSLYKVLRSSLDTTISESKMDHQSAQALFWNTFKPESSWNLISQSIALFACELLPYPLDTLRSAQSFLAFKGRKHGFLSTLGQLAAESSLFDGFTQQGLLIISRFGLDWLVNLAYKRIAGLQDEELLFL